MAKMFYSSQEAAERLGKSEQELKGLVRAGRLREFRDAGKVNYKVEDIEALAAEAAPSEPAPIEDIVSPTDGALELASAHGAAAGEESTGASASASGDVLLEPVEDSGIELAPAPSDVVSIDDSEAGATVSGATATGKTKEDTVVPSVGVNVFDDDELDEKVDPLAQTAVTDLAGLGMEGSGSGSGILDLTRESDDTSLGQELLEEIYTGEEGADEEGKPSASRIGEAAAETPAGGATGLDVEPEVVTAAPAPQAEMKEEVATGLDPLAASLSALMVVAIAVMWFTGLAVAALVRGIIPAPLRSVYANLWMYAAGALGVSLLAGAVVYLMAKRSGERQG